MSCCPALVRQLDNAMAGAGIDPFYAVRCLRRRSLQPHGVHDAAVVKSSDDSARIFI